MNISDVKKEKLSPMMQQYIDIKEENSDCILFFRLGDFYEMFFEDALNASRELELTLTGKQCGLEERAPMCGVPFHAAENYISRLISKGYKVAICEQTEDPVASKGLVKREVIQIVTPGTVLSSAMLNEKENNFIASVYVRENKAGVSFCDISTGEIKLTSIGCDRHRETLFNEIIKNNVREIITDANSAETLNMDELNKTGNFYLNIVDESFYRLDAVRESILRQFGVSVLHGIGIEEDSPSEMALGALILYAHNTQKNDLSHIRKVNCYDMGQHMSMDKSTIKNLELTETLFEKKIQGSLLGILDKTHTAMGSRKMKQWIKEPLNQGTLINQRLDAVECLLENVLIRNNIKECLKKVYDFQRLTGRIATEKANARDLIALKNSCSVIPDLIQEISSLESSSLAEISNNIFSLDDVYLIIDRGIIDEPPYTVKEGGIIKSAYSEELDNIKASIADAKSWISSLEQTERERTGIKNLKVGFNKVFGYYIEVTKSYFDLIPEDYIRKQTLVNCERFVTPKLKEMEKLVLNAEAEINRMEYDLFCQIRSAVSSHIDEIQSTSEAVATLDVLTAFAYDAEKYDYVRPEINDGELIQIEKGRHPVVEQTAKDGMFISNDTYLDRMDSNLMIITGPNMSGKSTYMRQTALIVLMAQIGCFVPAERAVIGICDRIFTRIGASDNLSQGQSTFFVEMSELSYILNTATSKSLIILDEIGRGTSTYDGLSIAWATVEYICRNQRKIRTLFATHYHELTVLEETLRGVKNLNVDVCEEKGEIVFLHKIVPGSADRSYGIHVAKIAGAPEELLSSAREHLASFHNDSDHNIDAFSKGNNSDVEETQISFFETLPSVALEKLKSVNLMETTPSQALNLLEELQFEVRNS